MVVSITISDAFDGGNVKYIQQETNPNDNSIIDVILEIKPDIYTELEDICHMQYFCFRSTVSSGITTTTTNQPKSTVRLNYVIQNAHEVSYPEAWPGTTVCYSNNLNDVDSWKRINDTFYMDGKLSWEYEHDHNNGGSIYFSYFPPFSYSRHLQLISNCTNVAASSKNYNCKVIVESLGQTLQQRDIDCIHIGHGALQCYIIHRQHPGETQAEHFAEGLLYRLLGLEQKSNNDDDNGDENDNDDDELVMKLVQLYTFHIIPCMCPDGGVLGHLRTNSVGANLNREWATVKEGYEAPTLERSPEVYHVLRKMDETGVDCFIDVHADEELPFNFISGCENIPNWSQRLQALHGAFVASYARATKNVVQPNIGYPPMESKEQALKYMNVATMQVCNRFNCFGITLEMPYKDCLSDPDPEYGWTPKKCRMLGASLLKPLEYIQPYLRTTITNIDEWNLSTDDAYIKPTDDYQQQQQSSSSSNTSLNNNNNNEGFQMLKKRFFSDVKEVHKKNPIQ